MDEEGAVLAVKILARHLTVDFYNCKSSKFQDLQLIRDLLKEVVERKGYELLKLSDEAVAENHFAVMLIFRDGHIALHVYTDLRYVAMDLFLCKEDADPEDIYKELQNFFKPDKTKTTLLKRGDFGKETEIKPKTKTRVAPLRKIHNTGAKVIRILARRTQR